MMFGAVSRIAASMSLVLSLIVNSSNFVRHCKLPMLASRYLSPNELWLYLAFKVERTIRDKGGYFQANSSGPFLYRIVALPQLEFFRRLQTIGWMPSAINFQPTRNQSFP